MIHPDDALALKEFLWPEVKFYDKQVQIIDSVFRNRETYVPAGNKLGKDFIAGFITLTAFLLCRFHTPKPLTCRIITTSVAEKHLNVLWGEIGRYIGTSSKPLLSQHGGPLVVNSFEIRRAEEMEQKKPYNYIAGMVYDDPEKLAGHHAEWTLFIGDEASGLDDKAYEMAQGWAHHMLLIGNCNPCANFFKRGVKGGDLLADMTLSRT